MTRQRDFKARVRARMQRTGERYSTARAHVLVGSQAPAEELSAVAGASGSNVSRGATPPDAPGIFSPVRSVGGQQADVAAARNLLASAGVKGPDGSPLTEAMVFGLAGGVGFLYGVFEYDGTPTMTIVGRNRSTPDAFLEPLFGRAGVEVEVVTTGSAAKARRELDRLLDDEVPSLCTVGAGRLDYLGLPGDEAAMSPHVVGVVGRDAGAVLLDDRAPRPHFVDYEAFSVARGAYPPSKHRMISVSSVHEHHDWGQALTSAIREGAQGYDTPPVPQFASNVGTAGLEKWHRLLTNPKEKKSWHRTFGEGTRAAIGLSRLYDCVTHAYTAPGAGRSLYADFLEESGAVTDSGPATAFRRSGECWTELATLAAGVDEELARYAELADRRTARLDEAPSAEEMAVLYAEQREIVARSRLKASDTAEVFAKLGDVLEEIIELERGAIAVLAN